MWKTIRKQSPNVSVDTSSRLVRETSGIAKARLSTELSGEDFLPREKKGRKGQGKTHTSLAGLAISAKAGIDMLMAGMWNCERGNWGEELFVVVEGGGNLRKSLGGWRGTGVINGMRVEISSVEVPEQALDQRETVPKESPGETPLALPGGEIALIGGI